MSIFIHFVSASGCVFPSGIVNKVLLKGTPDMINKINFAMFSPPER